MKMKPMQLSNSRHAFFRTVLLTILFFCASMASADEFIVRSLNCDPTDMTASVYSKSDLNGNPCALLKIVLPKEASNVVFEGSTIDIQNRGGEIYVYMTQGSKQLVIKAPGFEPLRISFHDYDISALQAKQTYKLKLVKARFKLVKGIRDISWIVGANSGTVCGDYLGVFTELKFGNPRGVGVEFGYGPGLSHNFSSNWTLGLKGFTKGWFISGHYGTTLPIYGKTLPSTINPDGSFSKESRDYGRYGFDFLVGFEKTFNWFHFQIGAGVIIPTKNTKILPAWSVGIGVDLMKLIK